ncbi:LPS assembly lipoprotein LptE [Aestuariispira ectoiniformans]|uniref:LPS assembly lipoprotein LptE n=1 Tax=Aestuariispira ectoiniformans TaxID=2775080 RepID=UPI00223B393D|nr:LPS assembly lipoprotein LptE [Aestuariispira ectoiniformans]
MWWRKLLASFVIAAGLTACGFEPLYGTSGDGGVGQSTEVLLSQVKIETIENRDGQILHNYLLDRLNPRGRPEKPRYFLSTALKTSTRSYGIRRDDTTTRAGLTVVAKFRLKNAEGKSITFSARRLSGYSKTDSEYSTLVAEKDALDRSLREIANDVRLRVGTYLKSGILN